MVEGRIMADESPEVIAAKAEAQKQIDQVKSGKDKEVSEWKAKHDTIATELNGIKPKYQELVAKETVYSQFFNGENKASNDSEQSKQSAATVAGGEVDVKVLKETYIKAGIPADVLAAVETSREAKLVAGLYNSLKPQPAKSLDSGKGSSAGSAPDFSKMTAYDQIKYGLEQREKQK